MFFFTHRWGWLINLVFMASYCRLYYCVIITDLFTYEQSVCCEVGDNCSFELSFYILALCFISRSCLKTVPYTFFILPSFSLGINKVFRFRFSEHFGMNTMLILDKTSILLSTQPHFFMAWIPQDVGKFPLTSYFTLIASHYFCRFVSCTFMLY